MEIAIVGTGYVGLVTGTCLADVGHHVTCVDVDERKIQMLRDGRVPIFEPGLEDMIRNNVEHGRITFSTNLSSALPGAEAVMIAVGTPEGEDGSADLQHVMAVAKTIGSEATRDVFVIVKSTVPVGTCDQVEAAVRAEFSRRGVKYACHVASNPEFLKEGAAIEDFMKPDRIVGGVSDPAMEKLLRKIYRPFTLDDPSKLIIMERRSSELTKYAANCMLATRISFMNELSRLCENVGANIDSVRAGMGSDPRIGRKFLYAGPGFGGSCFPKDVSALIMTARQRDCRLGVLEAVWQANKDQKEFVARKVTQHFGDNLQGKTLAVWGLAFKPGTDDVREAPAMTIIQYLLDHGASVVAHDPEAIDSFRRGFGEKARLTYADSGYAAAAGADGLLLVTEWNQYRRPNWQKLGQQMRAKVVFDLRNQYDSESLADQAFTYYCVGRPQVQTK